MTVVQEYWDHHSGGGPVHRSERKTRRYKAALTANCYGCAAGVLVATVLSVCSWSQALAADCQAALAAKKDIWVSCAAGTQEVDAALLAVPEVIAEINGFPDQLTSFVNYDEAIERTKYKVIDRLLQIPYSRQKRLYATRFAVELYKTMSYQEPVCRGEGADVCLGGKEVAYTLISVKIPPAGIDISRSQRAEYFRTIAASGYLDAPTSPASQTYATYPPPPIPGWSEKYEPERLVEARPLQVTSVITASTTVTEESSRSTEEREQSTRPSPLEATESRTAERDGAASGTPWGVIALTVLAAVAVLAALRSGKSGGSS